jgi:hypothetical protein
MTQERMTRRASKGACGFCGKTFGKAAITRHLASCQVRQAATAPARATRARKTRLFHLVVEGKYAPEYWMHLEVDGSNTLWDLDAFLRRAWLECCGHLSLFRIAGQEYQADDMFDDFGANGEESMDVKLQQVLRPELRFAHEYDFGTTTELTLRVVAERRGETPAGGVQMLAHNEAPVIPCEVCGQAATQVCSVCSWPRPAGCVCDACAPKHACGEDMLLPLVNSPRTGMCGYTGPGLD